MAVMIWLLIKQDLILALRQRSDLALVLTFFGLAGLLIPLGIGPEQSILVRVASGIIWVLALFASTLSIQKIFTGDFDDGTLEMLYLSRIPLELYVLAKIITHFTLIGLPTLVLATLIASLFQMHSLAIMMLSITLLLGLPSLGCIGTIGATLGLGTYKNVLLMALLIFPLYVPVLIFGSNAVEAATTGLAVKPYLLILLALFFSTLVLSIYASAANLRLAVRK